MESLFKQASPKRGRVILTLAGSLLLHGGAVGIASLLPQAQPPDHTVVIGEISEADGGPSPLAVPPPQENPTDSATPKPDDFPTLAPTPPPPYDPEMEQPADPTPPLRRTTVARAVSTARSTNAPSTSRVANSGPVGVTPGSTSAGPVGVVGTWVMPHPPYPHVSLASHATGETMVRVTTDAAGQISDVVIVKSTGNPVLDSQTVSYVREHWHGPANAARTTRFVYQIK